VYLEAEPGAFLTIARKAKGRKDWFMGAITNELGRTANVGFAFLPAGKEFEAIIYKDGKDADWEKNPTAYEIVKVKVNNKSKIPVMLAPGGGAAIHVRPL
jgi:hypothetical protein